MFRPTIFVLLFLTLLLSHISVAQKPEHDIKHLKLRLGFFAGPANYIGDYNPWLFGSDVPLNNGNSIATEGLSGDLDFGFWAKYMIKKFLFLRANASFGTLTFNIDDINHRMNTNYSSFGIAAEISAFNDSRIRPYLTAGISTFNYTVPLANQNEQFAAFNVSEQGDDKSAMAIPLGVGIDYHLSDLTTLFFETNLTLTDADDLDNISLPSNISDAPFSNDAFLSYRFGIGFSIVELFKLKFNKKKKAEPKPVPLFQPRYDTELVKQDDIEPKRLLNERQIEADKRIFFPEIYANKASEQQPEPVADTTATPAPVTPKTETSVFTEREINVVDSLRRQALQKVQNTNTSLREAFRYVPRQISEPFTMYKQADGEVLSNSPPSGYYIQIYASVGPANANAVLARLENIMVANPDFQDIFTFVTQRDGFYEVRAGLLSSYPQARNVLREIQGMFFDAYIILYIAE